MILHGWRVPARDLLRGCPRSRACSLAPCTDPASRAVLAVTDRFGHVLIRFEGQLAQHGISQGASDALVEFRALHRRVLWPRAAAVRRCARTAESRRPSEQL